MPQCIVHMTVLPDIADEGPYLVVSDGARKGHRIGYSAVLVTGGGVLATARGASWVASSWSADHLCPIRVSGITSCGLPLVFTH